MGEGNRIISLLIGLFVVIVIFTVLASRVRFENGLPGLADLRGQTTPTPTALPTKTPIKAARIKTQKKTKATSRSDSGITKYTTATEVTEIPATGVPTLFLPVVISGLIGGIYLRKKS